jgi:hypothetical protein
MSMIEEEIFYSKSKIADFFLKYIRNVGNVKKCLEAAEELTIVYFYHNESKLKTPY